jgi:PAT family beta-lactamase induction signal transducer AmpG
MNHSPTSRQYDKTSVDGRRSPWLWVPSLAFSDGLPFVAIMAISVILYKQLGLSNSAITFYTSWLYLPWILKPIWSPFIDLIKTKRWWVLSMEIFLGAAFGGVAFTIPTSFWLQGSLFFFWVIAFAGASHCIAADGFYMLGLNTHQQAWFMGIRSLFDRLATIFGQGILVMVAGTCRWCSATASHIRGASCSSGVTGLFLACGCGTATPCREPRPTSSALMSTLTPSGVSFLHTFRTFFQKEQVVVALLFICSSVCLRDCSQRCRSSFSSMPSTIGGLGLSPQEYGLVQGTVGVIGVALGGILGGIVASRNGLNGGSGPWSSALRCPILSTST